MRTLIVEDEPVSRRLIEEIYKQRNHMVSSYESAEKALSSGTIEKYAIYIVDLMLPGIDGIELCKKIKKLKPPQLSYVIIITAVEQQDIIERVLDAGADDFILKSTISIELKMRIKIAERKIMFSVENHIIQKAIKTIENRQFQLINSIPDMLFFANEKGQIIDEKYFPHCSRYFPDAIRKKASTIILEVLKKSELKIMNYKLNEKYFEARITPNASKEVLIILRDVTERKENEAQQEKLLKKIAFINKELKEFAHIVSHDLKTPLRSINSLASWIKEDYYNVIDEKGKKYLDDMQEKARLMHSLIDGILRYSLAGEEKEEKVKIDIKYLLSEILRILSPTENIKFIFETEFPRLYFEKNRIEQIFLNIISNAVKYNDKEKGVIKVGCKSEEGFWKFYIIDNGPGMPKVVENNIKNMNKLLTQNNGSGIGLSIVKKLVNLYGGEVSITSVKKKGTSFYFTLPRVIKKEEVYV
ncbi:MAG: response regulator [Spirochaetia bacterium]|nr:response regulator [Spirochaetia bacterium]